jgi:hypothetical protein
MPEELSIQNIARKIPKFHTLKTMTGTKKAGHLQRYSRSPNEWSEGNSGMISNYKAEMDNPFLVGN